MQSRLQYYDRRRRICPGERLRAIEPPSVGFRFRNRLRSKQFPGGANLTDRLLQSYADDKGLGQISGCRPRPVLPNLERPDAESEHSKIEAAIDVDHLAGRVGEGA
jgi:hypothetical protein